MFHLQNMKAAEINFDGLSNVFFSYLIRKFKRKKTLVDRPWDPKHTIENSSQPLPNSKDMPSVWQFFFLLSIFVSSILFCFSFCSSLFFLLLCVCVVGGLRRRSNYFEKYTYYVFFSCVLSFSSIYSNFICFGFGVLAFLLV